MEKIELRNLKSESIIIGILALGLGVLMVYWGSKGDIELRISGAHMDKATSSILLYLISLGPLLTGIALIMKFLSIQRYGEFVIMIDDNKITYPDNKLFRGYKPVIVNKSNISVVQFVDKGKQKYEVRLLNASNQLTGIISGDICHPKILSVQDLANKLNIWAQS